MKKILVIDLITLPVCQLDDNFFFNYTLNEFNGNLIVFVKRIDHFTYDQHILNICSIPAIKNMPMIICSPGKTAFENQPESWSGQNMVFDLFEENKISSDVLSLWENLFLINNIDGPPKQRETNFTPPGRIVNSSVLYVNPNSLLFHFDGNNENNTEEIPLSREQGVFAQIINWSQESVILEKQYFLEKIFKKLNLQSFDQLLEVTAQTNKNYYYLDIHLSHDLLKDDDQLFLIHNFIENTCKKNKSLQIRIQ